MDAITPAEDMQRARDLMVDGQVRPNKVIDPRILRAMRELPRERFVPESQRSLAYADINIPLGPGRAMLAPMAIARLVQLAGVMAGERVLVIGAGAGYGAALLDACGGSVTALEEDAALLARARAVLPSLAPAVAVAEGPLAAGLPKEGPWDVMLIEGAMRDIPSALAGQLRTPGGRIVTVLIGHGHSGQAVLAEPAPGGLHAQPAFDCAAPVLASFAPVTGFVF